MRLLRVVVAVVLLSLASIAVGADGDARKALTGTWEGAVT